LHETGSREGYGLLHIIRALATLGFVCASFTAVASLVLVVYTRLYPDQDAIQSPGGILLRVLLFGGIAAVSAAILWGLRPWGKMGSGVIPANAGGRAWEQAQPGKPLDSRFRGNDVVGTPQEIHATSRAERFALAAVLVVVALFLTVNLGAYPWAAPDEVHHLVVARNIAVHGSYASGHPAGGLRYFDSFDSVGPAVLGPIALAFEFFGVGLLPARGVMVLFFLGLCLVTYRFGRVVFGPWAGVVAVGLLVGAYSSI